MTPPPPRASRREEDKTGNGGNRSNESVAFLSAEHRQPGRDRAGHGGDEPAFLSAHAEGADGADKARRRARLRFGHLHRASLPHRRLRALEQSGAARPLLRDADQAHPRRPARHRAAGVQSDPRRRRHRHARPHDRRPRQRRLRARLPAPLGRRHGAADPRHPRRAAAPARPDRRRQSRRLRGELPHHQEMLDRGDADLRRQVLEGAGRPDAVDARDHGEVGQGRRERHREGGRRGAEATAEAASAAVPAVRQLGEHDAIVRAGEA